MKDTLVTNKPKLGFIGVGWIGRSRLEAIAHENIAEIKAISDPNQQYTEESLQIAAGAAVLPSLEELISAELDGIIIATPSALHAAQAIDAINGGKAVFLPETIRPECSRG